MLCNGNIRYGVSTNIYVALNASGLDFLVGRVHGCVARGRDAITPLGHVAEYADVMEGLSAHHNTEIIDSEMKRLCEILSN